MGVNSFKMFDREIFSAEDYDKHVDNLIELAIREDIGDRGDITSRSIFSGDKKSRAFIVAKEDGVLACLDIVKKVYGCVGSDISVSFFLGDGDKVKVGDRICLIEGRTIAILEGERIAINFLGHLSGIATVVSEFVAKITMTSAYILDTRKTLPGMRYLEKRAVALGGGSNHRMGLYDRILIKDNHIKALGNIKKVVSRIRDCYGKGIFIETEVSNLEELEDALSVKVNRILLDNMSLEDIKKSVSITGGRIPLEVSGNVSLDMVSDIAQTGVDFISVGSITMSSKALDLSLQIE